MTIPLNTAIPAEAALQSWFDAVARHDLEGVIPHYAADAVLLPTMSPGVYHGHARIREYFIHFLAKGPIGEVTAIETLPQGDSIVSFAGLYTFHCVAGPVRARFTFTYQKGEDGRWLIIHHHSSAEPLQPQAVANSAVVRHLVPDFVALMKKLIGRFINMPPVLSTGFKSLTHDATIHA